MMASNAACQPITATLAGLSAVGFAETPTIDLLHMESPSPLNPLGVKGRRRMRRHAGRAAIMSAMRDALSPFGVRSRAHLSPAEIVASVQQLIVEKHLACAL